jgi:hypothetical protein
MDLVKAADGDIEKRNRALMEEIFGADAQAS